MDIIPQDDTPRKQCTGPCGRTLPATHEYFSRHKQIKGGLRPRCKACTGAQNKIYRTTHAEQRKQYHQAHKEEFNEKSRQYNREHRDEISVQRRQRYQANREQDIERWKRYAQNHKEEIQARSKRYYKEHREEILAKQKTYCEAHKEHVRAIDRRSREARRDKRLAYCKQYYATHKEEAREYRERNRDKIRQKSRQHRAEHPDRYRRYYKVKDYKRRALEKRNGGTFTVSDISDQFKRQRGKCYYCKATFEKHNRKPVYHVDHIVPLTRGGSSDPSNLVLACPFCNVSKCNKLPHEWPRGGRLL